MRRWLFQGLQQRIEAVAGKHMYLVNDVHLETPAGGCVMHRFQQLAHVLHPGAGSSIDFHHVDEAAFVNFDATGTLATWPGRDPGLTVQAFCQDSGNGCFADPACAGEKESMVNTVLIQPVNQGLRNVLLSNQLIKGFWAPFPRQDLVAHKVLNESLRIKDFMQTQL